MGLEIFNSIQLNLQIGTELRNIIYKKIQNNWLRIIAKHCFVVMVNSKLNISKFRVGGVRNIQFNPAEFANWN